jgi:hypothetical protein
VHLPEIGIRGNTDFPFSDLNNLEIADLLSKWLERKDWIDVMSPQVSGHAVSVSTLFFITNERPAVARLQPA